MRFIIAAAVTIYVLLNPAYSQEPPSDYWVQDVTATSGKLAVAGYEVTASSGHSWPDGRQAVVSFWRNEEGSVYRCIAYFNERFEATGQRCERAEIER